MSGFSRTVIYGAVVVVFPSSRIAFSARRSSRFDRSSPYTRLPNTIVGYARVLNAGQLGTSA